MSVRLAGDRPGRRYSDLDLAIDAGRGLTLDEIAGLAEAFSDSDLPYKVDLAYWHNIEDRLAADDHSPARGVDRGRAP
jgi:predicted nucleotidyltransferase